MNHPIISKIGTALLLFVAAVAQAQSSSFSANGAFANALPSCVTSGTTVTCLNVFVSRGGTTSSPSTSLYYEIDILDQNTGAFLQEIFGYGTIPNSAFQVQGNTDSLYVDTSTVASFTNRVCNFDPSTFLITCSSGPGGVVAGKWTEFTPLISSQFSGTSKLSSPSVTFISTGTSDVKFALANVTALGSTGTDNNGQIGTFHSAQISITVK